MLILGLDVCKDSVVAWPLVEVPRNLKTHFKENKRPIKDDPLKFYANSRGIAGLLALEPDAVIMEPTGVHYSWIFAHICGKHDIPVLWVGHSEVRHYRKQNKLPDKSDQADALALAAYALSHWGEDEFFISFSPGAAVKLRECYLQLKSLARIQSPIINRLRQQLAREFPEAALKESKPAADGLSPLWAWVAGRERKTTKRSFTYSRLHEKSIAPIYGVQISGFSRRLAGWLCDIHQWERELEFEIRELLNLPEFTPYTQVFRGFGFGLRTQALILSQIYPISRFDSLGGFKRRLGMAKVEESSGDREAFITGAGSKMCRSALYLWVITGIAPARNRLKSSAVEKLGSFYDERRSRFAGTEDNSVKGFGSLIICQTAAYGCRLLFKELKRSIYLP
ncbi:transposase [Microcoleus sp. FACHB-68]|uniref:IS110 family transposase n=1 Tax=Microcoleus sp. FACHB-68 TaxID=2692826 RepID=UPI0016858F95|nr:transposase [Microcoleus sp. FACHB-68]MBD1939108.1 transposase [Microcoleus sp. FACHB-68]